MSLLLRIDSYALARPDGDGWHGEWCLAHRDSKGNWRFGGAADERLQPRRTDDENNEYLEAPETGGGGDTSDLDLAYLQLREFLQGGKGAIDLSVSGGIGRERLESLLGVLEALGCAPRNIFPTALLAARDLEPGRYGIIELGRSRSWISAIDVQAEQVRLESVREYGNFGFYRLFTQWVESAAEAFAAQHRFDIHRNLAANRGQLFEQMCQGFAGKSGQVRLSLDSRDVTLDEEAFQARWPQSSLDTEGLELRMLPPLPGVLPLPEQRLGFPACANPAPQAAAGFDDAAPEDGQARRCLALSC